MAEMWHEDLSDIMDAEQFRITVKRYRKNFNRFPRPADLIACLNDPKYSTQVEFKDQIVPDKITGNMRWHDDPDGTEYISLSEFKRRCPEYAEKLKNIGGMFGKVVKEIPSTVIYDDEVPF